MLPRGANEGSRLTFTGRSGRYGRWGYMERYCRAGNNNSDKDALNYFSMEQKRKNIINGLGSEEKAVQMRRGERREMERAQRTLKS